MATYAQLLASVQSYTECTESTFVATIPTMVQNVERAIYQTVHLPALRKNQTGTLTVGNKYLAVPTDFLAPYALSVIIPAVVGDVGPPVVAAVDSYQEFLINKDVEYIREAFPSPTTASVPTHYGLFTQDTFILAPTPDVAYDVELHYFYYPLSIVDAGSSWVGTNFPNALLYGTLVEAYVFLKGEADMLANYQKLFDASMMQLKMLGDGQKRQDTYRTASTRTKVT